jgi:subtilisin family serine protease
MSSLRIDQRLRRLRPALSSSLLIAVVPGPFAQAASVDPRVLAAAAGNGSVDAIVVLADQTRPLLSPLKAEGDYRVRRRALISALRARADHDQSEVRKWLDARGIGHRDFWIANLMQVRLPAAALAGLAARSDIARIDPNPRIALRLPAAKPAVTPAAIEASEVAAGVAWGVAKIEAPLVWGAGFTGQDVVIGGEDTGYQWDHPALKQQYRGWNGVSADHDYNWHDAIHNSSTSSCANNSLAPCDDVGHGTETAGTFAGDDGAAAIPRHQTGVAPGARWIGCRNMDVGVGTPARYIECMQWMLAPTDLNGANANSDLAPDVVSNSWACGTDEGCTAGNVDVLETAVNNLVAGGIFYAAAAQNSGPDCATILDPPAIYGASFDIGATDAADALADFSSRGPVGGDLTIRPDVSAPGVGVCTTTRGNGYGCGFTGTSAATPHVAGAVALILSAFPDLRGHPAKVAEILRATATTQGVTNTAGVSQSCGGTPITQWPNYMVGYGRVDAWNAVREPVFIDGFDR